MTSTVREGVEVEFSCGHKMVYDKHSAHGTPVIGENGLCRQCKGEFFFGLSRGVVGLRQCWINTETFVTYEKGAP